MTEIYKYVIQAIITVIIVLISMIIMRHNQPPSIVKIDLVAITTHYTEIMTKNTIDGSNSDEAKKISETIKNNLEPVISDYAKNHNVVVIQAQALIDSLTPDITDYVIQQLDKKIK